MASGGCGLLFWCTRLRRVEWCFAIFVAEYPRTKGIGERGAGRPGRWVCVPSSSRHSLADGKISGGVFFSLNVWTCPGRLHVCRSVWILLYCSVPLPLYFSHVAVLRPLVFLVSFSRCAKFKSFSEHMEKWDGEFWNTI
ncbi:hypothetical protein BDU57DRAFT_515130 [Ampelomyces quisqualis]|uniref:Uncharacterized protein n=1 Tax=Ampelomyces quisqualis TaxID=50730 RepID=A0A6A5QSL5_AMPQU|nr:hypothetical protein BDU57DRAFT_515130 [Ampelomyces quisqualis]